MTALLFVWLAACGDAPSASTQAAAPPARAATAVDVDDPEACATCHATVVAEWQQSMHSHAHHEADPIFGAMRALRTNKQGDHIPRACANCHAPRAPDAEDSPAGRAGVSCAACHAVAHVDRDAGMGAQALVATDGALLGPHDLAEGASPVHGTGDAPDHMTDGQTLCLACHDATQTPAGLAACTTGPEHADAAGTSTCVSCHMPRVAGPAGAVNPRPDHASHAFLGPHRAWYQDDPSFLQAAVDLAIVLDGDVATATLHNTSGHGFPTGFPGRLAVLVVEARDAQGDVVFRNIGDDPMADDPDAVLNKVYVDAQGKPVPAPFAERLARDTRLTPDETRTLTWTVPSTAQTVEAKLVFRLLPPKLAGVLGLADAPEATPKVAATARATR